MLVRGVLWAGLPTMPPPAGIAPGPRLLDRVRDALLMRHYSPRTVEAYVAWVRRFILFHGRRHPAEMGGAEVTAFLSAWATKHAVSASIQNQALAAILFLYSQVLAGPRATRRHRSCEAAGAPACGDDA